MSIHLLKTVCDVAHSVVFSEAMGSTTILCYVDEKWIRTRIPLVIEFLEFYCLLF